MYAKNTKVKNDEILILVNIQRKNEEIKTHVQVSRQVGFRGNPYYCINSLNIFCLPSI